MMKYKTFYCALAISLLLVSMTAHSQNPSQLVHAGRSIVNDSYPAQLVTDIQWARLDGGDAMDLVAVFYPVYKEDEMGYIWDRGRNRLIFQKHM